MTLEDQVKNQLGSLMLQILILQTENQTLRDENAKLKTNATE